MRSRVTGVGSGQEYNKIPRRDGAFTKEKKAITVNVKRRVAAALFAALLAFAPQRPAAAGPSLDASGFVLVGEAAPDVIQEIRYATTFNFVGCRVDGYEQPCALLTREAAAALKNVSDDLIRQGYRLKIYDAYRAQRAVDHFVRWARDAGDCSMKKWFYPALDKSQIFKKGYVSARSAHCRGSTVDVTLFEMSSGRDADMGSPFDFFDEISRFDGTPALTKRQRANRRLLRDAMTKRGFRAISGEWWHFTLKDEPYPTTAFDFPVSAESLRGRAAAGAPAEERDENMKVPEEIPEK